jgi:hypothetical protein
MGYSCHNQRLAVHDREPPAQKNVTKGRRAGRRTAARLVDQASRARLVTAAGDARCVRLRSRTGAAILGQAVSDVVIVT